jgi:hypothetical protein
MSRISQDFDELERLIDEDAEKDKIKSQLRFVSGEVTTLEAQYATLEEEHAELQSLHAEPALQHLRALYYASGDPIPFCPNCYEAGTGKRIHPYGPKPLHASESECWECYTCKTAYIAKPGENFLPHRKGTGRYSWERQ